MDLQLLMDELQERLEPKLRNSYGILDEVSRPRGYTESFMIGARLNWTNVLKEIGCTLLDMGITEADHIGVCFRHDHSGAEFQVASGLIKDQVDFKIIALEQWVPNENL